jgi:hypothetical protein
MKALLGSMLCAASAALLISCATVPEPRSPQEYLVMGRFTLACPTGFFGGATKSIDTGVQLVFRDVDSGSTITVSTMNGWFAFAGVGSGGYRLESSSYARSTNGREGFVIGPRNIGVWNCAEPGRVIYLGDMTLVYTPRNDTYGPRGRFDQPDYEISMPDQPSDYPVLLDSGSRADWTYDVSLDRRWDTPAAAKHLVRLSPHSAWLSRDMVTSGS